MSQHLKERWCGCNLELILFRVCIWVEGSRKDWRERIVVWVRCHGWWSSQALQDYGTRNDPSIMFDWEICSEKKWKLLAFFDWLPCDKGHVIRMLKASNSLDPCDDVNSRALSIVFSFSCRKIHVPHIIDIAMNPTHNTTAKFTFSCCFCNLYEQGLVAK